MPAASGIAEYSDLSDKQRRILIANLKALEKHFDYLIIDTVAGIDNTVQEFVRAAHCSIAVVSQEPTSLTDAFALLRVIGSLVILRCRASLGHWSFCAVARHWTLVFGN